MENKKVVAIVPALNEEAAVGNVLRVLLNSKLFEKVILVDDGSTDRTAEIGRGVGVEVIRLKKIGGSGKGNAIRKGLEATDAGIVAFFDADLIGLSEDHVRMLIDPAVNENIVMCTGIRDRMSGLPEIIAGINPHMAIGGERVIKRFLMDDISEKLTKGYAIESALNHYCSGNNLAVKYVILRNLDHVAKEKKWGIFVGLWERIKLVFQIVKLKIALLFRGKSLYARRTKQARETIH